MIGAVLVGLACLTATARAFPLALDLSDDPFSGVKKGMKDAKAASASVGNDPRPGKPEMPVKWISVRGGVFTMGADNGDKRFKSATPRHDVVVAYFEISQTLVTVEQYAECVISGKCSEPGVGGACNWGKEGRQLHPVNCVSWEQADRYAKFMDARLPTESEWEFAARGRGKDRDYPWGDAEPTCDRAVMSSVGGRSCGVDGTMPVCSKPAGVALVLGGPLCDMAGNVWEWTQDLWHESYERGPGASAPGDSSAWVTDADNSARVIRGGSYALDDAGSLRVYNRDYADPNGGDAFKGFRLARAQRD